MIRFIIGLILGTWIGIITMCLFIINRDEKKLFCKHSYIEINRKPSDYCIDYVNFLDIGYYDEVKYRCARCGKTKTEIERRK